MCHGQIGLGGGQGGLLLLQGLVQRTERSGYAFFFGFQFDLGSFVGIEIVRDTVFIIVRGFAYRILLGPNGIAVCKGLFQIGGIIDGIQLPSHYGSDQITGYARGC